MQVRWEQVSAAVAAAGWEAGGCHDPLHRPFTPTCRRLPVGCHRAGRSPRRLPVLGLRMKFRRRVPMNQSPGSKGPEEDADGPDREEKPKMVDSRSVEVEPGDRVIEYDGARLTIAPVEGPGAS